MGSVERGGGWHMVRTGTRPDWIIPTIPDDWEMGMDTLRRAKETERNQFHSTEFKQLY